MVFGTRYRLTALTVEPHEMPITMFDSMYCVRIRAADSATRSSRSTSLVWSGTGTTCACTPKRARMFRLSAAAWSSGDRIWMSTSPVSLACLSSRETDDRDVPSSSAIASIVRSCR